MTNRFLHTVADTILRHSLLDGSSERPVIVGLSGGADSVALLHALHALGHRCIAANCNFHLRGPESDRDTHFARRFASRLGIEFISTDFDVNSYLADHSSTSLEEACRNLRYDWFDNLRARHDAQAVAVGHHADDSIETLLFNLQRGTGLAGLTGISPKNDRDVIRPLIDVSREQILDYCRENGLDFVTDSTNLSNDFSRNKLRNIVVPTFESQFPNLRKGVSLTARNLSETAQLYEAMIEEKRRRYASSPDSLHLSQLVAAERNPSLLLYEWFKHMGLSRTQTSAIVNSHASTGRRFMTRNATFIIDRGKLLISPLDSRYVPTLDDYLFEKLPIAYFHPVRNPDIAFFSTDILSGDDLSVRQWQTGDRIRTFGLKGSKKVSNIFSDAKIPISVKPHIPLLVKGDKILWVTGLRQCDELKIKPSDTEFVKVTYTGPDLF